MNEITVSATATPVFQSKHGFHPFDFPTLKKLREINKLYHWREDQIRSFWHKEKKLPHNRFTYKKTANGVVKTPWVRPEMPEIPYVGYIIEEGRHGQTTPEMVKPISMTVAEIDAVLEEARKNYGK